MFEHLVSLVGPLFSGYSRFGGYGWLGHGGYGGYGTYGSYSGLSGNRGSDSSIYDERRRVSSSFSKTESKWKTLNNTQSHSSTKITEKRKRIVEKFTWQAFDY
ncbi:hypothetical protein DINM_006206 [Dirofilaria immitis]|nr:hypothetical protein [Dirofilaria immitis]